MAKIFPAPEGGPKEGKGQGVCVAGTAGVSSSDGFYSPEFRGDFGAGLLDLHAMDDTELLSEVLHLTWREEFTYNAFKSPDLTMSNR